MKNKKAVNSAGRKSLYRVNGSPVIDGVSMKERAELCNATRKAYLYVANNANMWVVQLEEIFVGTKQLNDSYEHHYLTMIDLLIDMKGAIDALEDMQAVGERVFEKVRVTSK